MKTQKTLFGTFVCGLSNPLTCFLILLVSISLISCKGDIEPLPGEGLSQVQFSMSAAQPSAKVMSKSESSSQQSAAEREVMSSLPDGASLMVTLENTSTGSVIGKTIDLLSFGSTYITEPVSIAPGEYRLTGFMVLDATDNAVYATPLQNSSKAHLVTEPLPINFTLEQDKVTTVNAQVVATDNEVPEAFGYVSFKPEVIESFKFMAAITVFNQTTEEFELTTADLMVKNGENSLYQKLLNNDYQIQFDSSTNVIELPDNEGDYTLIVTKDGYQTYEKSFTVEELKGYWNNTLVVNFTALKNLVRFDEFQPIPTNGARDLKYFSIDGENYLVIANSYNDSSYYVDSKIYKWNGSSFIEFQNIPTAGGNAWEYFVINGESYLAVANNWTPSGWSQDSKIYKWSGSSFVEFQSIPTNGGQDWKHFNIDGEDYLAVANYRDGISWNTDTDSKIYKWNGSSFVEFQSIPTNGGVNWEYFVIDGEKYLAIANYYSSTRNIDSKIYKWNGSSFVEFQSIPTNGAHAWEYFNIEGDSYLAVANNGNDSTGDLNSKIYKWDSNLFVEFQSIPTMAAIDCEYFSIAGKSYLAVSNAVTSADSKIYTWNGNSFVEFQSINSNYFDHWEYFTIAGEGYLAVTDHCDDSSCNINSTIYKAVFE